MNTVPAAPDSTRRRRWLWGSITVLMVAAGYVTVLSVNDRFFYMDDTESGAIPNWIYLGRILRTGTMPSLTPEQWMAGNYPVEGQGGLWNPVQIAINMIAPSVDNMVLFATATKFAFAAIMALGVYRVCLEYGARPAWAAVAGVAVSFTGFSLFYDQASWVTALTSTAWVLQAWASAVRYSRGRSGPLPTFVFLYLALSVGYLHPALCAGILVACLAVGEYLYQGKWQPSLRLLVVGACAGAAGAITFLPGALSGDVTWRTDEGNVYNDNFLTAPWSETFTASMPSALPAIQAWQGEVQPWPVTYIAWFLIPALAFVDWQAVGKTLRSLSGTLIFLGVMLIAAAGPSSLGPLRWPGRVLPFVAFAALIVVCVLLSRHGTLRSLRTRCVVGAVLVAVMVLRAGSSTPLLFGTHLLWGLVILAAGAAVLFVASRFGIAAVAGLLMASTLPVVHFQVSENPYESQWLLPAKQSEAKAAFPDWAGNNLQLGTRDLEPRENLTLDATWSTLTWGNYAKLLDLSYVNAYTSIGFEEFGDRLCMEYDGSTCYDSVFDAFATEPTTGMTYVDLMLIDRVILQRAQYPDADANPAPPGWKWTQYPENPHVADFAYVLERIDGPISHRNGRVAHAEDVTARSVAETDATSSVNVSSPDGGRVVFARLDWPGYSATLNGEPVGTYAVDGIFVAVDVPAGTVDGTLNLTWTPPGRSIGLAGIGLGLLGLAVLEVHFLRSRRAGPAARDPAAVAA